MTGQPALEYRPRLQRWFVFLTLGPIVGLFVVLVVVNGSASEPGLGVAVGLTGLGVVLARQRTLVGPDGIEVNTGLRTRRVPWSEVERFTAVLGAEAGTYAVLTNGALLELPWGEHVRRATAEAAAFELVGQLEVLRRRYRSGSA